MLSDLIKRETIGGKAVYTFESHHYAMIPWHELRREYERSLRLLTLDYHTDTMVAFRKYAGEQISLTNNDTDEWRRIAQRAVADISIGDIDSINQAVVRLKHDEHIDAALKANILSLAFVIASDNFERPIISNEQRLLNEQAGDRIAVMPNGDLIVRASPPKAKPPYTYTIPDSKIVILEKKHDYPWLIRDEEERNYKDAAIESCFLRERLECIENICRTGGVAGLGDEPFILDIDLDYFNTRKSIAPDDASVFHDLIRRSAAITLARESGCVQSCQLQGEELNSDYIEDALKEHIRTAMQSEGRI